MYDSIKILGSHTNAYVTAKKKDVSLEQEGVSEVHDFSELSPENDIIQKPSWEHTTYMLASYLNKDTILSASNYTVSEEITGYSIYREENGVLYHIADTDSLSKTICDFNTKAKTKLSFYVYPKIATDDGKVRLSSPIVSDIIIPQWRCWSVIGLKKIKKNVYTVDTNNIWKFEFNLESGNLKDTIRRQVHNTYSRFPKVMYGKQRYKEGSISCLIGDISSTNCDYHDSVEMMDRWDEFVNNGEIKLLKAPKGIIYPVDIYDSSYNIMDGYENEPVELSFNYVQVEDSNNMSVYLL